MITLYLNQLLSTTSSITDICGTNIYPIVLPNDPVLPAITYEVVGARMKQGLTTSGLRKYRIEINCWSTKYSEAVALRDAVINLLDGYNDATMSALLIQPADEFEHDLLQYRAMAEFYIFSSN